MEVRKVDASHGWHWMSNGLQLFFKRFEVSVSFVLVSMLIWKGVFSIPYAGFLLSTLLAPLVVGLIGIACRNLESKESFGVGEVLSTVRVFVPQLLRVGFIHVACLIVAAAIIVIIGKNSVLAMAMLGDWRFYSQAMSIEITAPMYLGILFAFVVSSLLFFATWYSPMLVVFSKVSATDAMKKSLVVSLRNLGPFFLYGIVLAGSWVVYGIAMYLIPSIILIPIGKSEWLLAAASYLSTLYWPIVAPAIYASVYASYMDVFAAR